MANELSKSFYLHFSIAICLYFHEVSGKIIFPDTFPETYLNSTCTCHFLHHKVSGKYVSGKIFPDSWKNVMILAANHVNDYLDARVGHSLQKMLLWNSKVWPENPKKHHVEIIVLALTLRIKYFSCNLIYRQIYLCPVHLPG